MATTTIADLAKHSDISFEAITEIEKNIKVVNNKEAFWGKYCRHDRTPKCDTLKYRHQILVDPTAVSTLTEGVIPEPTKVKMAEFSATLQNVGSWFKYSREEQANNLDGIVEIAGNQLAHERLWDLELLRSNAYLGTTVSISKGTTWEATFLAAKTQLRKNKAKPVEGGYFLCVAPGEVMNLIVVELGDKLKAVPAGEAAIIDGAIGACSGFIFVENDDPCMYGTAASGSTPMYALFIGKNEFGEYPVVERSFAGTNAEVISNPVGSNDKGDPLHQYGTIGSRIDGVGAALANPECVLKLTYSGTAIAASIDYASLTDGSSNTLGEGLGTIETSGI